MGYLGPDLPVLFTHPLQATGNVSRPQLFSGGPVPVLVFHDDATVWAYTTTGQLDWFIRKRAIIRGLAINGDNLYVLDGAVLSQYASETLHSGEIKYPSNAVSMADRELGSWAADAGEPKDFETLSARPPGWGLVSPPVCDPTQNTVHVLRQDGSCYSFPENLDTRVGSYKLLSTNLMPDALELRLDRASQGTRLSWISRGKVAASDTGELENPPGGRIERWRWKSIREFDSQPGYAFADERGNYPVWAVRCSYQDVPSVLIAAEYIGGELTAWFFTPGIFPKIWSGLDLDCAGAGTCDVYGSPNKYVTVPNQVRTFPPAGQTVAQGGFTLRTTQQRFGLAAAPYVLDEPEGPGVYAILKTESNAFFFVKYRFPKPQPSLDWTMRWWQEINRTIATLNEALPSVTFIHTVIDASRRNFDAGTVEVPRYSVADYSHYGAPPGPLEGSYNSFIWDHFIQQAPSFGLANSFWGGPRPPYFEWYEAGRVIFASEDRLIPISATTVSAPSRMDL